MINRTKPCKWATGELDVISLEWNNAAPHLLVYRRCCQNPEHCDPGPCIFCMENWTRADHTAADVISDSRVLCRGSYRGAKIALNRITPEPKIS